MDKETHNQIVKLQKTLNTAERRINKLFQLGYSITIEDYQILQIKYIHSLEFFCDAFGHDWIYSDHTETYYHYRSCSRCKRREYKDFSSGKWIKQ